MNNRTVPTRRTRFIIVNQMRSIILGPFVLSFNNKCFFFKHIPEVVRVCAGHQCFQYRSNVCTISIETKSQHPKALIKEQQENSFGTVLCGWVRDPSVRDPSSPRKVCYLLVAFWVRVFRFVCSLSTGVLLGRTERLMASSGSLQGIKQHLFQE